MKNIIIALYSTSAILSFLVNGTTGEHPILAFLVMWCIFSIPMHIIVIFMVGLLSLFVPKAPKQRPVMVEHEGESDRWVI